MSSEIDLRDEIRIDEYAVGDPAAATAAKIEQAVFLDRFGDTEEDFAREYGPVADRSALVVASRADRIVAVTRVAWADATGEIKTLNDAALAFGVDVPAFLESVDGPENVLDALTISAVDHSPGADGRSIGGSLTVAMGYLAARKRGCTHVVSFLDSFVFDYLVNEYGVPWEPLPGAVAGPYMGSVSSVPAVVNVAATAADSFGDLSAITNGRGMSVGVRVAPNLGDEVIDLTSDRRSDTNSRDART